MKKLAFLFFLLSVAFSCHVIGSLIHEHRIAALESAATNNAAQIRQLQQYAYKVGLYASNQQYQINESARALANIILLSHLQSGSISNAEVLRVPDGAGGYYEFNVVPLLPETAPTNRGLRKL